MTCVFVASYRMFQRNSENYHDKGPDMTTEPDSREPLTLAEAAARLGMTVTHVARLAVEDRIETVTTRAGKVGVPALEVDRILSARRYMAAYYGGRVDTSERS